MPRVPRKSTTEHRDAESELTRKPRCRMASSPKPAIRTSLHAEPAPCDTMVSVVASSDYLTSVNHVTVYETREYAACNEAIATEYPLLQGSWDFEEIDYAFKLLNDSKLEDLDPKYIQKQAKKATGLEARSSDLVVVDVVYGQVQGTPWMGTVSNYGVKTESHMRRAWFSSSSPNYFKMRPVLEANCRFLVTPPAAEGEQFAALARSSDALVIDVEQIQYRLGPDIPASCDEALALFKYWQDIRKKPWVTLRPELDVIVELKTDTSTAKEMLKQQIIDFSVSTDFKAFEARVLQQIEGRVIREPKLATERIAELEASLQESRTYGQQQKEKLDAMVRLYNRTVRKDVAFRVRAAEPLPQVLASYEISRKYPMRQGTWGQTEIFALAIIAQITAKPVLLYRDGWAKPELVETSKHYFSGPIRVGSLSVQHMGRTFNTPQEWRAYYEPIIARLDSPDASA